MAGKEILAFGELLESLREVVAGLRAARADIEALTVNAKASDVRIDKLSKNIGGLSNKWGDLGEAMTVGESIAVFNTIDGVEVYSLHSNIITNYKGKEWEIDGIAIGKELVIVIEAKATLKETDVKNFVAGKLKIFTELEPSFENKKIYGAIGFLSASAAVQAYAQQQGLLLIHPTETSKELVSFPQGFKLRDFHP